MPTYYEILKVQSTAAQSEIETALDAQYNQWRRLVTHHDPNVVEEANRSLRTLEQIRNILTNPIERAKYDAGQNIGGLADPEQLLRAAAPSPVSGINPPGIVASSHHQTQEQRVDAWVCPKCKSANTIGEQFCKKCGNSLSQVCPKCNAITEKIQPFCSKCGVNKSEALREKNLLLIKQLQENIKANRQEIGEIHRLKNKVPTWGFDKSNKPLHRELWAEPIGCGGTLFYLVPSLGATAFMIYLGAQNNDGTFFYCMALPVFFGVMMACLYLYQRNIIGSKVKKKVNDRVESKEKLIRDWQQQSQILEEEIK
jgi:curved DNA-binding protein CbpA